MVKASAPGSLMWLGEHAVLHGRQALVSAVNSRISVTLTPRKDDTLEIVSDLGSYRSSLRSLVKKPEFSFVLKAIAVKLARLPSGLRLDIKSEFSSRVGFGSSAAVTVATLAAINRWLGESTEPMDLYEQGTQVIREVQGLGSGADVAASVWGGILNYRQTPRDICRIEGPAPNITAVYSGKKEPTVKVVKMVEELRTHQTRLFDAIFDLMGQSVEMAAERLAAGDWAGVGGILNINQGFMEAIGVGNLALADIVFALRAEPGIFGAKISGSGRGDCVLGLGSAPSLPTNYETIPVAISEQGVQIDD